MVEVNQLYWTFLQGGGAEIVLFNQFFSIVVAFGLIGWGIGLLCQLLSGS